MYLGELTLVITNHAYQQYCERVGHVDRDLLHRSIAGDLQFVRQTKSDFLKLNEVWWVYLVQGEEVRFVTCYGNSIYNLPAALNWAKQHNDRLRLGEPYAE